MTQGCRENKERGGSGGETNHMDIETERETGGGGKRTRGEGEVGAK
jgi:hypothetical protein